MPEIKGDYFYLITLHSKLTSNENVDSIAQECAVDIEILIVRGDIRWISKIARYLIDTADNADKQKSPYLGIVTQQVGSYQVVQCLIDYTFCRYSKPANYFTNLAPTSQHCSWFVSVKICKFAIQIRDQL